jgi:hypothetical protein
VVGSLEAGTTVRILTPLPVWCGKPKSQWEQINDATFLYRFSGWVKMRCQARGCNHHSIVDVSELADDVPVPSIGPRLRCMRCGHLGADVRPNWSEYRAPEMGR